MRLLIAAIFALLIGSYCQAEEERAAPADIAGAAIHGEPASEAEATPHPTPAADPQWARSLVIAIFAMFLAAIPAGLILRSTAPQEMAVTHSHDEPPGSAGDHHADAYGNRH